MTLSQETCLKTVRFCILKECLGLDDGKVRGSFAADFFIFCSAHPWFSDVLKKN